jgi:hypothetical protein
MSQNAECRYSFKSYRYFIHSVSFFRVRQRLGICDGGAFEKRQPNICTNAK